MPSSTLAADRLEFVLSEMRDAIREIENVNPGSNTGQEDLNAVLLAVLKQASGLLAEAQDLAEENGIPKLAVFAA